MVRRRQKRAIYWISKYIFADHSLDLAIYCASCTYVTGIMAKSSLQRRPTRQVPAEVLSSAEPRGASGKERLRQAGRMPRRPIGICSRIRLNCLILILSHPDRQPLTQARVRSSLARGSIRLVGRVGLGGFQPRKQARRYCCPDPGRNNLHDDSAQYCVESPTFLHTMWRHEQAMHRLPKLSRFHKPCFHITYPVLPSNPALPDPALLPE